MRAATQSRAVAPSARPLSGLMPVQLAPAVQRKPTAIVATKPQSISCACQATAASRPRSRPGAYTQSATATAAHRQPAK
ncbi:MAG: hypothetical protein GAK38_01220 [Xylophilus sp.]|nr:MAG: hypothetical protein GAK38_01220 [Xylophilus sp.]